MSASDTLDTVLKKLQKLGWLSSVEYDRQDISVIWTRRGREHFPDFLTGYRAAVPDATDAELQSLADHLYYFGIKKRSRREQLEHDVGEWLGSVAADTITVIAGEKSRTFAKTPPTALYDYLYAMHADDMTLCGDTITLE